MEATFNEKIIGAKIINNEFDKCVCSVKYEIICFYKGKNIMNFFDVELGLPSSENFIEYENLTQEQMLDWVKQTVGEESIEERKSAMTSMIEQQIEAEKDIPQDADLPWNL